MSKKRPRQKPKETNDTDPVGELETLLIERGVEQWDAAIVTDGSGSIADKECGWASYMVFRHRPEIIPFYGAMSCGSNNTAELMAFVQPLLHYVATRKKDAASEKTMIRQVVLVTDSTYLAERKTLHSAKNHLLLWRLMQAAERDGIVVTSIHIPRATLELNRMADRLAGRARKYFCGLTP